MRPPWKVGLALWSVALLLGSSVSAYELLGPDWTYQANPMGEDWRLCTTGMPEGGSQRTRDGALAWNYTHFHFTFGTDACLSGGVYPTLNDVNQVDYGGGLGAGVLAQTAVWSKQSTGDITECDMRFSNAPSWYTGTGTPAKTQYDWQSVAAHEMGHCLGLGHEADITNPKPVMYPGLAAGEVRRSLTSDDQAGRDAIYGGGCSVVAFASRVPSDVAPLPAAIWLAAPILFVAGWKLALKREKGVVDGGTRREVETPR